MDCADSLGVCAAAGRDSHSRDYAGDVRVGVLRRADQDGLHYGCLRSRLFDVDNLLVDPVQQACLGRQNYAFAEPAAVPVAFGVGHHSNPGDVLLTLSKPETPV